MRDALRNPPNSNGQPNGIPRHFGLAYDSWAPTKSEGDAKTHGKVPAGGERENWLQSVADSAIDPGYKRAFNRWESSLRGPHDLTRKLKLESRLLIGHGNTSATEVGLTVHHTWGVPLIPGSALKGMCANYVAATYGGDEVDRKAYRGVMWDERRIRCGPGEIHRVLFGAPDAQEDLPGEGAESGSIIFHDALYFPGSTQGDKPFAVDVLTVHQRDYYGQEGSAPGGSWPNDYDSPNPVGFITVRPGAQFLIALTGPKDWTDLAIHFLTEALTHWGLGGKTSAGYGRGTITGT